MALVKTGKAAEMLGVDVQTLRAWEKSGELIPDRRSAGGVRYYDVGKVIGLGNEDMPTIGYARVSSHDQRTDLVRQQELLEAYCAAKGWRHEVIADLGSGLNYRKKGLNRLLELMLHKRMRRLVLTHKDRLLRFGSELIFAICEISEHRDCRPLGELTEGKKDEETSETAEPPIITKSMRPEDVQDEAVRDLLVSMQETQLRAMSLYAKYLMEREKK
jgi:predicted site-specific integrase-resolvase